MKSSFDNHMTTRLRRLLCIIAVILLLTATLAGCGKKNQEDTTPSTEDSMLELPEDTTEAPEDTQEVTEDPTSETIDPEYMKIRSAPDLNSTPIGELQPGQKIDILREEVVSDVRWALIREGWICIEYLEAYTGPDGIIIGDSDGEDTPTTAPTQATTGNTGNGGNGGNTGNTGNTGNAGNNNTGTKKSCIVTGSELNIRKGAGTNYDTVGQYKRGDRIYILETSNGWGRTDKGWVSMEFVYEDGTAGKNSCKGIITGDGLNIRSGPGTNYDGVGSYNKGTRVHVLERIQIGNDWWGCTDKGWISLKYVYVDGDKGEGAGFGTVSGDAVYVRSGPGTQYDAIGSLNSGTELDVLCQMNMGDMTWGCIKYGNGYGWISMSYVGMG